MTKRVLIVDDDQAYLDSLVRALSEFQTIKASNLDEAKLNANGQIDFAILDIRLSETDTSNNDGIVLLHWLRERYPHLPIIMMSAYRDFDSIVYTLNREAASFLKKPINLQELKDLISSLTANLQ